MLVLWDEDKNHKLKTERGVCFEVFAELILEKRYRAILENPSRPDQNVFIVPYRGYTYVVPFILDGQRNIVLKTVFPSRKYHRLYGGKVHEDET